MVVNTQKTNVAYRCPHCGGGIMSAVGIFDLGADMLKLKCSCGKSELPIIKQSDGDIRLDVPCTMCAKPHTFTLSPAVFFGKDLFVLSCPYTGMSIGCMGDINHVKAELARSELELLDIMKKCGIKDFSALHEEEPSVLPDPQIREIVMYVLAELDDEGKIFCNCTKDGTIPDDRELDAEIEEDGVRITCRGCGASKLIPTGSLLDAHAFLECDSITLEGAR